jgi:hypothetical protein
MPVLGALARWGRDWAWGPPREGEEVDVGAIVRLAPALLRVPRGLSGTLALAATGKRGARRDYVLRLERGRARLEERSARDADARVSGSERAWVAALGPDARRDGLRVSGDRRLAEALLDALSAGPAARRADAAA